jgi:hypothetical protein
VRIDRRLLGWGVFFLLLGGIPLLVQSAVLDPQLLAGAWRLWPLVIVGLGLGLILGRTPFAMAGSLLVAATFGVILGSLLAAGPTLAGIGRDCGSDVTGTRFPDRTGTFAGSPASVDLRLSCRHVTIATADGNGWSVTGTSRSGEAPRITSDPTSLTVRGNEDGVPFVDSGGGRGDWTISVPRSVPINLSTTADFGSLDANLAGANLTDLSITANFSNATLDLSQAKVQSMSLTANFASTAVHLPSASNLQGSVTANFGSLALCVPASIGLRVTVNGGAFSSTDLEGSGMTRIGNTWTSAGYDAATARTDLTTTANFGSVQRDGEACR